MKFTKITPGKGGKRYVPYEERTGNESAVYFTRDRSAEGTVMLSVVNGKWFQEMYL